MYVNKQKSVTACCYYKETHLCAKLPDLFRLRVSVGTVPSWWGRHGGCLIDLDGPGSRVFLLAPEVVIRYCLQSPSPVNLSSQLVHSPKGCPQPPTTALPFGDQV